RSPRATLIVISRSTWRSPNHLLTPWMSTCGIPNPVLSRAVSFEAPAVLRHAKADREVDGTGEEIDLDAEAHPPGVHDHGLGGAKQIEQSDDDHERRVLE